MTCEEVIKQELMEQYLLGRLARQERDAFDEHLFECEACFERLQTLRAVRHELAATAGALAAEPARARWGGGWIWKWAFVPALATLIIVSVIVGPRLLRSPADAPATPTGSSAGGTAAVAPSQGQGSPRQDPPPEVMLAELGRFEPPPFTPGSLRGGQDAAAARFREGMRQYARGDYPGAMTSLRAAARLDPEAAHALFFLGISAVLNGQHDEGVRALRQTIQLGDSPFLEEAHFYLAKAALQQHDPVAARQALLRAIALKGPLEQQARQLLAELDKTQAKQP